MPETQQRNCSTSQPIPEHWYLHLSGSLSGAIFRSSRIGPSWFLLSMCHHWDEAKAELAALSSLSVLNPPISLHGLKQIGKFKTSLLLCGKAQETNRSVFFKAYLDSGDGPPQTRISKQNKTKQTNKNNNNKLKSSSQKEKETGRRKSGLFQFVFLFS